MKLKLTIILSCKTKRTVIDIIEGFSFVSYKLLEIKRELLKYKSFYRKT
jgi:hypothetical protein